MKKDLGVLQAVYPMPVLMIATYDENGKVDAPLIDEFPLVMECELAEIVETENLHAVVGKIVNVAAEESVLDENGKVDPVKLNALAFDNLQSGYYEIGTRAGQAWSNGKRLMG